MSIISATPTTPAVTVYPLTTLFTPDPLCILNSRSGGSVVSFPTTSPALTLVNYATVCAPAVFPTGLAGTMQYMSVSPGVCPLGWTPGRTANDASRTSVICCPIGILSGMDATFCTASFTTPAVFYSSSRRGASLYASNLVTIEEGTIYNSYFMTVTWESSDLNYFTPASAPLFMRYGEAFSIPRTTSTSTTTSTTTIDATTNFSSSPTSSGVKSSSASSTNTAIPTLNDSDADPSGAPRKDGLSTGAQAGIGVGAAAGGLLLLGVTVFSIFRRRRTKQKSAMGYKAPQSAEIGGFQSQPEMLSR